MVKGLTVNMQNKSEVNFVVTIDILRLLITETYNLTYPDQFPLQRVKGKKWKP